MAEESEASDAGAGASGAGIDPAAVALALGGASRDRADSFLKKQEALVELQAKELAHELELRHWSLWVRHASGLLKLALELAAGLLLLFAVTAIGVMVWNAAHADGLVIESFSVPPDLTARGLTGEVVASQLLDRTNEVLTANTGVVEATTASISRGDDIKVEIPDTGISLGELYRFLRRWLGHETMVDGEVYRTSAGLALAVRINNGDGMRFAGSNDELDSLMQKAAERVVELKNPITYAGYLSSSNPPRTAEAMAILQRVGDDPLTAPRDRSSALNNLSILYRVTRKDAPTALALERRAVAAYPQTLVIWNNIATLEIEQDHPESLLALAATIQDHAAHPPSGYRPLVAATMGAGARMLEAQLRGDYGAAAGFARQALELAAPAIKDSYRQTALRMLALQHDGAARALLDQLPRQVSPRDEAGRAVTRYQVEAALENWPTLLASEAFVEKAYSAPGGHADPRYVFANLLRPILALAKARLGDLAGAQALIAGTPGDCDRCVRIRGMIAAEAKQWGRADYWFAKAVHDAPSIPLAETDWGQSFLMRGDPDGAIAKFTQANQKGPHFADPLEGWGEALMKKNRSDLALGKFEEAEKYAPNWGRLHLKWGEALTYAGKKEEAQKQYAISAGLDLSNEDEAELAKVSHG